VPPEAHQGRVAASIGEAGSAVYLQSLQVAPGERYLCELWAKRTAPDAEAGVQLTVRWQTPGGAWLPDNSHDRSAVLLPGTEGWQPLQVAVEVPEGAGRLVFMCSASGRRGEAVAVFDDAAAYRIPREAE